MNWRSIKANLNFITGHIVDGTFRVLQDFKSINIIIVYCVNKCALSDYAPNRLEVIQNIKHLLCPVVVL